MILQDIVHSRYSTAEPAVSLHVLPVALGKAATGDVYPVAAVAGLPPLRGDCVVSLECRGLLEEALQHTGHGPRPLQDGRTRCSRPIIKASLTSSSILHYILSYTFFFVFKCKQAASAVSKNKNFSFISTLTVALYIYTQIQSHTG